MKKIIVFLTALLMGLTVFTACGGENVSERENIIIGISGEGSTVDPHNAAGGNRQVLDNISMGLTRLDKNAAVIPGIAKSWTVSDNDLEYIFTIDDTVKFANGDPVTVDDVVFSLKRGAADLNNAARYEAVDTVEALDSNQVKICLKYPCALLLPNLSCNSMCILSKKVVEARGADFNLNSKGACAGPYDFDSWESGVSIKLIANPYFNKRELPIKKVEFRFLDEASTGVISVESGNIDAFLNPNYVDIQNVDTSSGIKVYSQLKNGFNFIGFYTTTPPLDNVKVRQAFAYAYDAHDLVVASIGEGGADTANTFLPGFVPGSDRSPSPYTYNPEKAKALLAEAGYPDGVELDLVYTNMVYQKAAEYLQETVKNANIKLNISMVERSKFINDMINGSLQMFLVEVTEDFPDADLTLYAQFKSDGGQNVHAYSNQRVDELLLAARQSSNQKEREEMYLEVQQILRDELPALPIYFSKAFALYNGELQNFTMNYAANIMIEYISWKD